MTRYSAVVFGAGLTIAALLAIIAGFMMIGSPDHVRKQELDRTRSSELAAISGAVSTYRRTQPSCPLHFLTCRAAQRLISRSRIRRVVRTAMS